MQGKALFFLLVLLVSLASVVSAGNTPTDLPTGISAVPLAFTPNMGQWNSQVLYRADGGGAIVWFTHDGAFVQFNAQAAEPVRQPGPDASPYALAAKGAENPTPSSCEMIKLDFIGADLAANVEPAQPLDYSCNFFLGNDRSRWRTDVPSYREIRYKNIYPGIDLRYYSAGGFLEYEFIVAPGADASRIKLRYNSPSALRIARDGSLIVGGKTGQITELQPVVYQAAKWGRLDVKGSFRLLDDQTFTFVTSGKLDATLPTVIDPIVKFATYLGGSALEESHSIDVSSGGNAYVVGYTTSADFPTVSPYDGTANGSDDIFLTKFSTAGNTLVYSTYIGGSGADWARDVDEDGYGEVAITGFTQSANFPLANAYDNSLGGTRDAFLTRVNSAGNGLLISTYHGGSGLDDGFGVYADGFGFNYYICGFTASADLFTQSAYDATQNGDNDVFVAKYGALGFPVFSTFVGGSGSDLGWELKPDASANVYVVGLTNSGNFPTVSAYDATANGSNDIFAFKLGSTGATMTYSTYIGSTGNDQGLGIDVDNTGAAYLTGLTNSAAFPTLNAYDATANGGYDCFLVKLAAAGNALVYSTYFGGNGNDYGYSLALDRYYKVYICGRGDSNNLPLMNPADGTYGGLIDAFVCSFATSGNVLCYSSYVGGSGEDIGLGIAMDYNCYAYAAGYTKSNNFPTTNPYDATLGGTTDAFVIKTAAYKCGDFNGDGLINQADATAYTNYFLYGTGIPCPIDASDTNGDGINLSVSDLVYLANYLNGGGPAPVCP